MKHVVFVTLLAASLAFPGEAAARSTPGQIPPHPPRMPDGITAFPGAWGGGMFTTGGRRGQIPAASSAAASRSPPPPPSRGH